MDERVILLRYNSRFEEFFKQLKEKYTLKHYIYTDHVHFINQFDNKNIYETPEKNVAVIIFDIKKKCYEILEEIKKFKKQKEIGNLIKCFILPLTNSG